MNSELLKALLGVIEYAEQEVESLGQLVEQDRSTYEAEHETAAAACAFARATIAKAEHALNDAEDPITQLESAAQYAIKAMENMRQGSFRGATERLRKALQNL